MRSPSAEAKTAGTAAPRSGAGSGGHERPCRPIVVVGHNDKSIRRSETGSRRFNRRRKLSAQATRRRKDGGAMRTAHGRWQMRADWRPEMRQESSRVRSQGTRLLLPGSESLLNSSQSQFLPFLVPASRTSDDAVCFLVSRLKRSGEF